MNVYIYNHGVRKLPVHQQKPRAKPLARFGHSRVKPLAAPCKLLVCTRKHVQLVLRTHSGHSEAFMPETQARKTR